MHRVGEPVGGTLLSWRKPKLLRSRLVERPLNEILGRAVAKLFCHGKRLLKEADKFAALGGFIGHGRSCRPWPRGSSWIVGLSAFLRRPEPAFCCAAKPPHPISLGLIPYSDERPSELFTLATCLYL